MMDSKSSILATAKQKSFIFLPKSTSYYAPSCRLRFQRPFPTWSWSNACCWQRLNPNSSCSGGTPVAAMQFQRVKHYAKLLDASVDGDGGVRTDCAGTLRHLPDKDSKTSSVQRRLQHARKYRQLPCPSWVEGSASLQHLANADPSKLLESAEPGPKVAQFKKCY